MENLEALNASEKKYRRLFETAPDGIIQVDFETGQIQEINPFLVGLLGYTHEELIGKKLWELGLIKDTEASKRAFRKLQEDYLIRYEDLPLQTKDGREISVEFVSNVYGINGTRIIQCNVRDISARKLLEHEREDFLAMMTHDIKSPLTTILGYTDLLLMDRRYKLDDEAQEAISAIEHSARKILQSAEGYLNLARLESGKAVLNKEVFDVAGLMREAYEGFMPLFRQRDVEMSIELAEKLVCELDANYVQLAVNNMVDNALKYTPHGGRVTISASTYRESHRNFVVIIVADTGPGISKEELHRIFEKYYRSARTANVKDTGLGLAIVKEVANVHGGWAEAACPEGGGCIFKLFLPGCQTDL